MRFVIGPDGTVVPDLRGKLPGRGAWVTPTAEAVRQAVRKRLFARAFRQEVAVPATLAEHIEAMLRADLRSSLSMANKAGAVTSGFSKVEAAIRDGRVDALIEARDASPDGHRKLRSALQNRRGDTMSSDVVVDVLTGVELDMALGRQNVVHAALLTGPGSDGFLDRWRRHRRFTGAGAMPSTASVKSPEARE